MSLSDEDQVGSLDQIEVLVTLEVYLRGRAEPYQITAVFPVDRDEFEMLDDQEDLETFTSACMAAVLTVVDIRGEERFVFTDSRKNKFLVMRDEVQAISILAPDVETIQKLLVTD